MGLNFYICCHVCREKLFLYRLKESLPMHKFYRKHERCLRISKNAIEVRGDYQEEDWMAEENKGGYKNESWYKDETI